MASGSNSPNRVYLPCTFANLPTGSGVSQGDRGFITDSNSVTFHATAATGGSSKVPVYFDGTNWIVG